MGFLQEALQGTNKAVQAAPGGANIVPADKAFGAATMPAAIANLPDKLNVAPIGMADLNPNLPELSPARPNFLQRLGIDANGTPEGTGVGGRRSVLDILGRVADTVAKVGGADPLYQQGLDAAQAKTDAQMARDWQEKFNSQKYQAGQNTLADHNTTQLGQISRGLASVLDSGGAPAVLRAAPVLARQLGMDDKQAAAFTQQLQTDPEGTINALHAATSDPASAGSQPREAVLYALAKKNNPDLTFTDFLGQLQDIKGRMTPYQRAQLGQRNRQLDYTASKDRAALAERRYEFDNKPVPGGKGNAASTAAGSSVLDSLDRIQAGFDALHQNNALPGEGSAMENAANALGRTGIGQIVGEQLGSPNAQKRLEISKSVSALQQEMIKSLPASAVRTKFEQEMIARGLPDPSKMDYNTARTVISQLRDSYIKAMQESAGQGGGNPRRPANAPAPRTRRQAGVTVSNW